jgi:hypothetical protein
MDSFDDWFKDIFIPALEDWRQKWNYDGPMVLMLDRWITKPPIVMRCSSKRATPT